MERKFTTESFDKFKNAKTISTIRKKKFGGWTETHEPNQSIILYKNDMAMPSLNIDLEVRLFATAVYNSNPTGEEIYIELLNYYKDSHADKGSNKQNFKDAALDLVIDNEIMSIKAIIINDGENRFARSGLENKDIFTREQLIKFPMSKEQFTKLCDGKNISIRISGITNAVRLGNNDQNIHEFDSITCNTLQIICKQLFNESIQQGRYTELDNPGSKATSSGLKEGFMDGFNQYNKKEGKGGGCFIATAAMGNYDHPTVIELRFFRDTWLLKRQWGINFTKWYYQHGPKIAHVIEKSFLLQKLTFILIVKPLQLITRKLK
jgi:hypothetical protein